MAGLSSKRESDPRDSEYRGCCPECVFNTEKIHAQTGKAWRADAKAKGTQVPVPGPPRAAVSSCRCEAERTLAGAVQHLRPAPRTAAELVSCQEPSGTRHPSPPEEHCVEESQNDDSLEVRKYREAKGEGGACMGQKYYQSQHPEGGSFRVPSLGDSPVWAAGVCVRGRDGGEL